MSNEMMDDLDLELTLDSLDAFDDVLEDVEDDFDEDFLISDWAAF